MIWLLVLVASLAVLVKGADWFTGAAERIGLWLGMPSFLVGVTIVAIGTSIPELVACVLAVLRDASEIVPGTVIGSNVANLLLILPLAAIVGGRVQIQYALVNVDLPFFAGSAFLLAFIAWDGGIGRFEALLCLLALAVYLHHGVAASRKAAREDEDGSRPGAGWRAWLKAVLTLIVSGALIYGGAEFTVRSVVELARLLEIGREVIAATAVALGTALPEVSVTIAASRRGKAELAVGNVLGSNVFNALAAVGVSGLVGPIVVPASIIGFALPLMLAATVLVCFMIMENEFTRWEGWLLVIFYAYFLGALFGLT